MEIWRQSRDAFVEDRTHRRCLHLALGLLTALGRRTISRGICATARQFVDWCSDYRFFSKARWSLIILEQGLLSHLSRHLNPDEPLVVACDDTHLPKSGKKIPASGYFYDSKSPRFARSFSWQLRFLSISVLLKPYGVAAAAKGIVLRLKLAPKLPKPKKRAADSELRQYRKLQKHWSIASQLAEQLLLLRAQMDGLAEMAGRMLVVVADSSYVNKTVIRAIPDRCVLVGRTRKNLKLYKPATRTSGRGRTRCYGESIPTPEQIRQDPAYPWNSCTVFAAGKWHNLRYKTLAPLLWKSAGHLMPVRPIVIEPLAYRLSKYSKLLYRSPAYLLVSNPGYPVHLAIQHYFHRWEIEVNHRDIKSSFGVGDAQVTNPRSVARQFAFAALVHSWLEVAYLDGYGSTRCGAAAPLAKWRNDPKSRPSSLDMVTQLRLELLLHSTGGQLTAFPAQRNLAPNTAKYAQQAAVWLAQTVPKGLSQSLWSSILYADA